MTDTRQIVLEVLLEYEKRGTFLSELMGSVLSKYAYLEERDRAFIKALAEGTVQNRIALDHCIDVVSNTPVRKMRPVIRTILRMGACQILYMDHVPDHAAVSEAVRLVRVKHIRQLTGFVNGILRALSGRRDEGGLAFPDLETEYSCPEWIAKKARTDLGDEAAERMIRSMGQRPPLYLRANRGKTDENGLLEMLRTEGNEALGAPFPEEAVQAGEGYLPFSSRVFQEGCCSVQDISSMQAVKDAVGALPLEGQLTVADVCASPGGKACFAAELLAERGRVLAYDISEAKVTRIRDNIQRLGLENITALQGDALAPREELVEKADLLIADLPCSGLGVMNRKVDIKYRVQPEDIVALCKLQREILRNVFGYLKPGGILLFSTCTFTAEETWKQDEWIEENGFHKIVSHQFLQGSDPCDGFHYAVFRR